MTQNADSFHWRGATYRMMGKPEEAVRDLDIALALNSKSVLSLNLRGTAEFQLKRYDEAIRDYSEALRLEPARTHTYINRANAYHYKREYEKQSAISRRLWS